MSRKISAHCIDKTEKDWFIMSMPDKILTAAEIEKNLSIVRHVRLWMKFRSLTQAKIADLMGVSEGLVSKWFNGKQTMDGQQIVDLTKVLDISIQMLLTPPGDEGAARRLTKLLEIARVADDNEIAAFASLLSRRFQAEK